MGGREATDTLFVARNLTRGRGIWLQTGYLAGEGLLDRGLAKDPGGGTPRHRVVR